MIDDFNIYDVENGILTGKVKKCYPSIFKNCLRLWGRFCFEDGFAGPQPAKNGSLAYK